MFVSLSHPFSEGSGLRRGLAAAATAALVVSPLAAITPASANPANTGLVISEVYGGGGNTGAQYSNDFIELYNPTGSPVSLTGHVVEYFSSGGGSGGTTTLTGTVPAHGHFLIQEAAGTFTPAPPALPTPDATGTLAMSGTNGSVELRSGAGVLDLVGYGTATRREGTAAPGLSNTTAASRDAVRKDTDVNSADFTAGAPAPENSSVIIDVDGPAVDAVENKTFTVDEAIAEFTLSATGGATPYTWSETGLPAGLSLDPDTGVVSGTPTAAAVSSVTVTVTDADDATGQTTFTITVNSAPGVVTPIADIQGTAAVSPLLGATVTTEGVVTAAYPVGGYNGFYLQTGGADTTPDASDGLFVYGPTFDESTLSIGDTVNVTGEVSEFGTLTQITASTVEAATTSQAAVQPKSVIPGTDCAFPGDACLAGPALDTARESVEGEVFAPTVPMTVTDAYDFGVTSSSFFGEIGLAAQSSIPLIAPTEVIDAQNTAAIADRTKYNNAHLLVLDDGSSTNYWNTANTAGGKNDPVPWLTQDHTVRVGAEVSFDQPVVLDYRFGWKLQPQRQVVGKPTGLVTIEQNRPATPAAVGGDLQLATFNVLNYFTTLGASRPDCSAYLDRANNPIATRTCTEPNGPRGAWDQVNFERQQAKIVKAINTLDADVVSLEELENSKTVKAGDRDEAIGALVTALNADAGSTRWAFVPSPASVPASEDVIRTGFIYDPATVQTVGDSVIHDVAAFDNARDPLAQVFKPAGGTLAQQFAVIVNHFKSKGSGFDDGTGQGNANPDRIAQAQALTAFASTFSAANSTDAVFLTGDFNAYSMEDPVQEIVAAGYTALESTDDPQEESYSFAGASGSLDHVFANAAAEALVDGVDIWEINANEPLYYQYSRYNYIGTDLYSPNVFGASDHNPEIVGINTQTAGPTTTDVQIIGSNDYHGRLAAGPRLAAYVKAARAANPDTVFAAAGDLVGATTFESFLQHDKPTIDVMNEAGLDVSSVGNHEFDAGYDDLVNRIMAPYDATTNPEGGAEWQYLGANVKLKADGSDALERTWIEDFGDVQVGFVGAVTEDLPSLVSADGIADIEVTDIVDATNEAATELKAEGADVVVLLVHEGAASTSYAASTTPGSAFGDIVNGVSPDVDAIVSGHTHLAYNHSVPVPAWAGRAVTERPVVSAGQYGENLNKLVFTVDNATGEVTAKTQEIVPFAQFPAIGDAATQTIVDAANAEAQVLGARPLGKIEAGFSRAKFSDGTTENRGGESTVGNLVAEVQRWATGADIAFMNPGGLRADMTGTGTTYPRTVTYKNAADVQPFGNTLLSMDLTGSSIKKVLEQQWQRNAQGQVPGRPFLKLGASEGFNYTYDRSRPEGDRITGMWLDGVAIQLGTTYKVAANAFLASGTGDNFFAFSEATNKRDSGKIDLQAMVDYMAAFAPESNPLAVDYAQRSVGVSELAADYAVGETVTIDLTSLSMTGVNDVRDTVLAVEFDAQPVGEFPVTTVIPEAGNGQANSSDEAGTATVSFRVPAVEEGGTYPVTITGVATGTEVTVPVEVQAPTKVESAVTASVSPASIAANTGTATIAVEVTGAGGTPTGTVAAIIGGTVVGGGELVNGKADVVVGPFSDAGNKSITVRYYGDAANLPSETVVALTVTPAPAVEKATAILTTTVSPASVTVWDDRAIVSVNVTKASGTPTGAVLALVDGKVVGASQLFAGRADIELLEFTSVGTKSIEVRYFGDDTTKTATSTTSIEVVKAEPTLKVEAPKRAVRGEKVAIKVTVSATGFTPTGNVTVETKGNTVTKALNDNGAVTLWVRMKHFGNKKVQISYDGDGLTEAASKRIRIKVKRR